MVSCCPQNIMGTKYFISFPHKPKTLHSKGETCFPKEYSDSMSSWKPNCGLQCFGSGLRLTESGFDPRENKQEQDSLRKPESGSKSYILFCSLYNEIQHRYYRDFGSRCSDRIRIRTCSKFEIFNLFTFRNQI